MNIGMGRYSFEGPFDSTSDLRNESGVYAILGRHTIHHTWKAVDIGESEDVKKCVENHDRKYRWKTIGYALLSYAAYYCGKTDRSVIEKELRDLFDPPCGESRWSSQI